MSFLWNRSCQTSSLDSTQEIKGIQPSNFDGGLDDLESFQAWSEEIKTEMSRENPSLYEVLGEIASSKQPIEEGDIFQASQRIMKEKQKAPRVLQAKKERASFTEEKAHQLQPIDEHRSTEADKLQIRNEGRQLGCLLVQKTKGETQLQVTRWLSATNGWEAWRQLNLSIHFKLLASLMKTNFDDQPASSSRDKPEEETFIKQQLDQGGKERTEGRGKGEAYPPQPPAYEGKGKPDQLPKRKQWCSKCWKKGHRTQACWWNSNQQHHQQHQQQQAWYNPSKQQPWPSATSKKGTNSMSTR